MMLLQRHLIALGFAVSGIAGLAAFPASATEFTTQSGKIVPLTSVETMNCPQMEDKLRQIDATRYRENAPVPHNEEDKPLFHYENSLSQVHYERCVITPPQATAGANLLQQVNGQ